MTTATQNEVEVSEKSDYHCIDNAQGYSKAWLDVHTDNG